MFTGILSEDAYNRRPNQSNMTKRQYYKAMCGRRLANVQEQLRLMRNLSNKNNYDFTSEDIDKLEEELVFQVKYTIMTLRDKCKKG